ncbi:GntR family transcriptional regulator [Pigmentiphaga litoralis]|uniref:GntR family transcriptional regulator n=1 Tax=Pigmentiphaga litoralis TaxID=516702 RepID=UPI003B42AFBC
MDHLPELAAALPADDVRSVPKKGRTTSVSLVYQALRTDLVRALLAPGERLRIQDLSERYGCGVIPIREALNRLASDGLVSYSEQRGFSAAMVSVSDALDICRARVLMSDSALRASIEQGDDAWEERVVLSYHRLKKVPRYESLHPPTGNLDYDEPHRAFHTALISACGSQRMIMLADQLFVHAERYRYYARRVLVADPDDDHRAVMDAALARNVELALALAKSHIEGPANILVDALRKDPPVR